MVMLPSQAAPDWRRSLDRLAFSGTTQRSCSAFLQSPSTGAAVLPSSDLLSIAHPYTSSPSLHQRQRMRFEVHSLRAGPFSRLKSSHEAEAGNLLARAAAHVPAHHGLRAQGDRWPRWPSMAPAVPERCDYSTRHARSLQPPRDPAWLRRIESPTKHSFQGEKKKKKVAMLPVFH